MSRKVYVGGYSLSIDLFVCEDDGRLGYTEPDGAILLHRDMLYATEGLLRDVLRVLLAELIGDRLPQVLADLGVVPPDASLLLSSVENAVPVAKMTDKVQKLLALSESGKRCLERRGTTCGRLAQYSTGRLRERRTEAASLSL